MNNPKWEISKDVFVSQVRDLGDKITHTQVRFGTYDFENITATSSAFTNDPIMEPLSNNYQMIPDYTLLNEQLCHKLFIIR